MVLIFGGDVCPIKVLVYAKLRCSSSNIKEVGYQRHTTRMGLIGGHLSTPWG